MFRFAFALTSLAIVGCHESTPVTTTRDAPSVATVTAKATSAAASASAAPAAPGFVSVALPGATAPVFLDYLGYEAKRKRVWVPVADTGSVDVYDIAKGTFTRVDGLKTAPREVRGKTRIMGPTAVAIGDDFGYVGDRATNQVCAVDATNLTLGACFTVPQAIDGLAYVATAHEVWVTTPHDTSIAVLDASKPAELKAKTTVKTDGAPEGYGVDEKRGLFFTNLEDKDKTLAIDVKTHAVRSTWDPACGGDGPRGLAVDAARGFVVVACTDHLQVLDAGHDGARLGRLDTGAGVDNIDYAPDLHLLVVAAGKAARFTLARLDDKGQIELVKAVATSEGTRNVVTDDRGNGYIADALAARLLIVKGP